MNAYENLKARIKSKDFKSQSSARFEISSLLIKNQISNAEHAELRSLLNEVYKD